MRRARKNLGALNIACRHLIRHPRGNVLWLANRWELVAQASRGLIDTGVIVPSQIGKFGKGLPEFREKLNARFLFSTVQTWCSRSANGLVFPQSDRGPLLVVVDECHWAAKATQGKKLLSQFLGKASIVGLSATPNLDAETHNIAYAKSFADLCPEYLRFGVLFSLLAAARSPERVDKLASDAKLGESKDHGRFGHLAGQCRVAGPFHRLQPIAWFVQPITSQSGWLRRRPKLSCDMSASRCSNTSRTQRADHRVNDENLAVAGQIAC
ncbi:DEAD/DEAH box helicase family protein [Stieleria sp. ICT_E10.1]|nr:DEAD/DEAH box helicase family protein [Stieleria sedimenti]MCS7468590.1 DEAD/DEAH box helicase family protein [Stieleria sedimenti]